MEKLRNTIGIVLIIFFCVLAGVLISAGVVVLSSDEKVALCDLPCTGLEIPAPPDPPVLTDTALSSQQVSLYQQQVAAYKEKREAYAKYLDTWSAQRKAGPDRLARYQAVAKDVLLPILNPIVAAFIAYVFVKGAANVVQNLAAARKANAELKDLDL